MNNKRKIIYLLVHLIPWIVLIFGPFASIIFRQDVEDIYRWRAIGVFVMLAGSFYLNYFLLIPKLLFPRKFLLYGISLGCTIITVIALNHLIYNIPFAGGPPEFPPFDGPPPDGRPPGPFMFPNHFAPVSVLMLLAMGVAARLMGRWMEQTKQHKEIKQEQTQTELAFLKNQISPHFFFNTLNNIYALTETDPAKAREVTHKLSKLMRYLLYESEKDQMVTLGREITFLKTYVELMKVRLPDNVQVSFEHGSEMDTSELPPLLFISFVENAFKHGISLQENCSIRISLMRVDDVIKFSIINTIPAVAEKVEPSGGLGLQNIRRRLELLFGKGNYTLEILANEHAYDVQLKIPANGNKVHSS